MATVGEHIKWARLSRDPPLRLVDVAGDALSAGMLSKIERGLVSPSLSTLSYLAQRLGVPLARLFEDERETEA
ncbi:MAG: helix-turn-helix domain-containing protein, partial [Chloroflexota bacterium]